MWLMLSPAWETGEAANKVATKLRVTIEIRAKLINPVSLIE